jgi:probable rRNA maturation factor
MLEFEVNQQAGKKIEAKLWRQWLSKIQKALKIKKNLEISVGIVNAQTIKRLNRTYRGKNQITDVLSFNSVGSSIFFNRSYLGEVIICYPRAEVQAKKAGWPVNTEIELLLTHGFLHLLGYDHQKLEEAKVMRQLENKILSK